MNTRKILLLCLVAAAILISCKKNDSPSERYTNLIGKWQVVTSGDDLNNNHVLDSNEMIPRTPGVSVTDSFYDVYEMHTLITPAATQKYDCKWALTDNDKVFALTSGIGTPYEVTKLYDIASLTGREFIYSSRDTIAQYVIYAKL